MKRLDFKNITKEYFETCYKIIENGGICGDLSCDKCPFYKSNSTNRKLCIDNGYKGTPFPHAKDMTLLNSAKEFLKFRDDNMGIKLGMHVFGIETEKVYLVSQRIDDVLIGITPDGDKIAFDENGCSLENKDKEIVTSDLNKIWKKYIGNALYKCDQEESGIFIRRDCCSGAYYYDEYTQEFNTTESIFEIKDGYDIDTVIDLLNVCGVSFKDFMELVNEL